MVASRLRWPLPAALCAVACAAAAQTTPLPPRRADPLDAAASVPAVAYTSTLGRSRRQADDTPIPWREANDTAARIGGWRAYAREAQGPAQAPPAAAATAAQPASRAMPMPSGHGRHHAP